MADFFKNETKRRITAGIVTGVMAFSTVISNVAPALAETADTGTPTTAEAPANPAEATNVAAPKAEKAGYTFVGWAKDPGASTTFVLGKN